MRFTKIPTDTFEKLQINAGILAANFTPETGKISEEDMLGATSGGINFTDVPEYTDYGEDIDNAPKNTKELKRIDRREISMSGTFLTVDTARAKQLIGAADIDGIDTTKITPRDMLKDTDFTDIWLIADYSSDNDETTGGYIAIHMMNALSTGGFALQTGDKAKGQFAFTFMAHYSMADQTKVPYEMYIKAGSAEE